MDFEDAFNDGEKLLEFTNKEVNAMLKKLSERELDIFLIYQRYSCLGAKIIKHVKGKCLRCDFSEDKKICKNCFIEEVKTLIEEVP